MANSYTNSKFYGLGYNPIVDVDVEHVIPLGSKISTIGINDGPILDAFNIDWTSGKYSYDGDKTHIIESTGQLIEELRGKASTTSLDYLRDTVNSLQTKSADYYEQRWRTAGKEETVNAPDVKDLTVGDDDNTWHLTPQYESGKHTWMTSRKVVYVLNGSTYVAQYSGYWSTPMKMTGNDGSVAYPVHQVLLYKWTDSRNAPIINSNSPKMPEGWQESPGNTSGNNTYLWMIQGQRQNSNYIKWDADGNSETAMTYWSSPICLSGSDGKPGKDGRDVEFIYKRFTSEQLFTDNNNPANWAADQNNNYRGPAGYTWNDNPEGVSLSYPYEYCSIRYKTDGVWGTFIPPFLWSKYGEDGVDGDGVEYIFYRSSDKNEVTFGQENLPPTFNLDTFQKSEVLGNNWTDDPQGVDENNAWEYVSVRKFKEITDSNLNDIPESFRGQVNVGDKIWFPYSEPALWSKYAFDAVASNLTIETDNDVMAVAINGQNMTRNTSSNSAQVFLYHNLSLLSSDKYTVKFISHNLSNGYIPNESNSVKDDNDNPVATITNTDNKWLVTINIPANVSLPQDGSFNFQIMATVSTDISIPEEIRGAERLYTFKVIGLSLSTIYQLKTDKIVVHRDIENKLENVNVTMFNISDINDTFTTNDSLPENFYIFAKPIYTSNGDSLVTPTYDDQTYGNKLFTKTNDSFSIDQYKSKDISEMILTSVEFNLVYTSDAVDKQTIIDSFSSTNKGSTLINNGVLVDRETISVISDGANGNPGVDSKSQEYIYFLCDEFNKTFTGDENPATWISNKPNYQTDDYPFIGTDGANILNNGWTDHPQGISETQRYEYISTRTYDTSTKTWGAFSEPVIWANWGHSGEDGDGVEYIYYLCDNEYVDVNKYPLFWSNDVNFDSSEYIKENSNWTDKPSGTSSAQKYEYVSVRKYKRIKNNSDILHLLFDDFLLSILSNEYDNFLINTDWEVQPGPNITLLDYIFNICENYYIGISSISSNTLENPQSDWYDKQTIGNDFNLYGFIYEALSKYFNYEERQATYDQGSGTCTYFKLIEKNDKFWTPYSEPTLWAKYGEKGADGEDAYVLDWTNDQINLAVDENGKIKPNQTKSTTLKTNSDNIKISSVEINTTLPFTYTGNVIYGKYNISFKIAPEYNDDYPIPESGIEVTFTVTLTNNKTLTKVLNICGQHIPSDGVDGQNAVTYEILSSANSATRNTTNVISPSAITLSALKYSGIDITTLTALPEYLKFTYVFGNESNISKEYDVDNTYAFNLISTASTNNFQEVVKPGSPNGGAGNESEIYGEETNNSVIENEIPGTAEQSGVQETSLTPGVEIGGEIGGGIGGDVVGPSDVSFKVSYTNVYLSYLYNNEWKHIDVETIPIIDHGEKGAQGFTGPVVRMRGEFKERDTEGYYSDGSAQKNYDESTDGIRYKDIVWYNNQYWTPNPEKCDVRSADGVQASYVTRHTGVIACYDSKYWPGGEASYWVPATQFDFVATKLLYADQALINQISTHDLIATNQNGYPVAGVTSGSKMYDKDNAEITSYLSTLGIVNYSENAENDSANVRIFAGEIWNGTSYSLTYAPFNVRQDGTAYMSKANIEGTVTASNLKLKENVSANTQDQNGSFTYWDILNESRYVPILNDGEVGLYYILSIYGNSNNNIRIQTPSDNAFFKKSINGKSVLSNNDYYMIPPKNTLCQLVGINADNITYWNIIETPLAEQKIPDTILEHYDCTDDLILFAYNYEDYNSNGETINYFCTRPNDYDSFTPIRNVTFNDDKMTSSTDVWVEYTFLTYLESDSYKHTTNGAYANLGSLKYIKPDYKSPDSEGGVIIT